MEVSTQTITISLTSQKMSAKFNDCGIEWCRAFVDWNYCFLKPTFCYRSNIIAN